MKLSIKDIIYIIIIIFLSLGAYKLSDYFNKKEIEKRDVELREFKIKNDTLKEISRGYYSKLVADTLTRKELRDKIKKLELEIKDPVIVEVIKFRPEEKQTDITEVEVENDTIIQTDYYPKKEDYFIKYTSKTSISSRKGVGMFSFQEHQISLGIGRKKDGTYEVKTKVPEWLKITKIDVEREPTVESKKDNFGFIVGGGYGKDNTLEKEYLNVQAGIRYKKTYFSINGATNNTISAIIAFEL